MHNIACDDDGLVYVADRENHRVQVFDGNGKYQAEWRNMMRPCGLYVTRGKSPLAIVGELGPETAATLTAGVPNLGPRVSLLSAEGEVKARLGTQPLGEAPGQFIAPTASRSIPVANLRGRGLQHLLAGVVRQEARPRAALAAETGAGELTRGACGGAGQGADFARDRRRLANGKLEECDGERQVLPFERMVSGRLEPRNRARVGARTICGRDIVLYRRTDGGVAALEDACWHRLLPLSMGRLAGDQIVCGYHGLVFNSAGRCTHMPAQKTINPSACVRAYPVVGASPSDLGLAGRSGPRRSGRSARFSLE